jgi:hypothetical protein
MPFSLKMGRNNKISRTTNHIHQQKYIIYFHSQMTVSFFGIFIASPQVWQVP